MGAELIMDWPQAFVIAVGIIVGAAAFICFVCIIEGRKLPWDKK